MAQTQQTTRLLKSVPLEDYTPDSAHVRTDLADNLGTVTRSTFKVDFELLYEVHGGFDIGDEDNASFLVIRAIPKPQKDEHQFVWLKITLTVLPDRAPSLYDDEDEMPVLASIEPASAGDEYVDVYTTNETRERALKGSLGAEGYGATAGVEASRTSKSEFKTLHLLRVKAGCERTNTAMSRKKYNQVWWYIKAANPSDGIGDSFTVALLVTRPKGSKFRLEASTDGEIGVFSLSEKMKGFLPSGLHKKNKQSLLAVLGSGQPGTVQRLPEGVSADNLHAASTDGVMADIKEVGLHLAEKGRLVKSKEGPVGSRLELEGQTSSGDKTTNTEEPISTKDEVTQPPPALQVTDPAMQPEPKVDVLPEREPPRTRVAAARTSNSMARMVRLRKMAALYDRLADLLREEARDCLSDEERAYADELE